MLNDGSTHLRVFLQSTEFFTRQPLNNTSDELLRTELVERIDDSTNTLITSHGKSVKQKTKPGGQ